MRTHRSRRARITPTRRRASAHTALPRCPTPATRARRPLFDAACRALERALSPCTTCYSVRAATRAHFLRSYAFTFLAEPHCLRDCRTYISTPVPCGPCYALTAWAGQNHSTLRIWCHVTNAGFMQRTSGLKRRMRQRETPLRAAT